MQRPDDDDELVAPPGDWIMPDIDPPKEDMTRSTMTAWIVGAIILVGLAIFYQITRLPDDDPFKECERIIGMDRACEARIAARNMMRGF